MIVSGELLIVVVQVGEGDEVLTQIPGGVVSRAGVLGCGLEGEKGEMNHRIQREARCWIVGFGRGRWRVRAGWCRCCQ